MSYKVPVITLVNRSTVLSDATVESWVAPLQIYVADHLKHYWNVGAHIGFAAAPLGGDVPFYVEDDSDAGAGVLGYHDVDSSGHPYAKVFARMCEQYGASVTECLTHELAEYLGDPLCQWSGGRDDTGHTWALELGDPVEGSPFTVASQGVSIKVANFVTPAFFIMGSAGPWDACGKLKAPLSILAGGYASIAPIGQWGQIGGEVQVDPDDQARVRPRRGGDTA